MPQGMQTLSWNNPATSRLLFEGAVAFRTDGNNSTVNRQVTLYDTDRSVTEQSLGLTYGNWYGYTGITGIGRPGANPGPGSIPRSSGTSAAALPTSLGRMRSKPASTR